jgi:glucose/arabinose dehydrogenase
MTFLRALVAIVLFTFSARAATLPGFRVETLVRAPGFVSSLVTDSQGTIYFTTTSGWIYRVDAEQATPVASLPTRAGGNGGLLGMALLDDETAVVHYTTWNDTEGDLGRILDDVLARVDLKSGTATTLHSFVCDIDNRARGASSEHHGGNPAIGPDGSILVGIGEYGGRLIAQKPEWNGGKIWRVDGDGSTEQWARGMRNPYDLAWDPNLRRIVVADNGEDGGDELHVVDTGENCGWPQTYGTHAPMEGAVPPVYVFPTTVAPTGLARLDGANALLRSGYLLGAFATKAIYYFPSLAVPVAAPIPLIDDYDEFVIDVTQAPNGDVLFATASFSGSSIHRLQIPLRGDCNGDGLADYRDVYPLLLELQDGAAHATIYAQDGAYAGSWGCDANADGVIEPKDMSALASLLSPRRRAVGRR